MNLFQPKLSLVQEPNKEYTLFATTQTPNSCFKALKVEPKKPPGQSHYKSAIPVTLYIEKVGDECLEVITPVHHKVIGIKRPNPAILMIAVFVVYDGEVVGSNIISFAEATINSKLSKISTCLLSGKGVSVEIDVKDPKKITLTYEDSRLKNIYKGGDIDIDHTKIGILLTIIIDAIPDLQMTTFSVLVPNANIDSNAKSIPIKTFAVRTTHKTSIGGPDLVKGQIQLYETIELEGSAWKR